MPNNLILSENEIRHYTRLAGGQWENFQKMLDPYATFSWRGEAATNYHAFIINDKNSLHFYNGATFTNEYTQPQFETAVGHLSGVKFAIQKIDFTIGVYWFTEQEYRKLIYWLHPYEINSLRFDFEPKYFYQVKLSSIAEGKRYILDKVDGENRYYTEMKLTFEVQGPSCAYYSELYEYEYQLSGNPILQRITTPIPSDLPIPFKNEYTIPLPTIINTDNLLTIESDIVYNGMITNHLFDLTLKNLTFGDDNTLVLQYDSENGLITWKMGNDTSFQLLNTLSTCTTGKKIVQSMNTNYYKAPGQFDHPDFDWNNWSIQTAVKINGVALEDLSDITIALDMRARTNLI